MGVSFYCFTSFGFNDFRIFPPLIFLTVNNDYIVYKMACVRVTIITDDEVKKSEYEFL